MLKSLAPIGVMDSGLGGLSVVMALQKLLPQEDILYFGDTANCPYGNKSREELLRLSSDMLRYLEGHHVKCVALACNTTSSLADELREVFHTPIITVAESAADAIARQNLTEVGLIATVSTVNSGIYPRRIAAVSPNCKVYSVGSVHLARLVETGVRQEIEREIRSCMDSLLGEHPVNQVILGCTHYPLVLDIFQKHYPQVEFIDPAPYQALCVKTALTNAKMTANHEKAKLTICTTGDVDSFRRVCEETGLERFYEITYQYISTQ